MDSRVQLQKYYDIFRLIVEVPRITPKAIAKEFRHSGRGKSPSTWLRHIQNMYQKGISQPPRLTLKCYERYQYDVYFCIRNTNKGLYNVITDISNNKYINYCMLLSGEKFLVMSRYKDLNLEKYDLTVIEKSRMFTPIYTIPKGWKTPINLALENLSKLDSKKGLLPRTIYTDMLWNSLDWKIFNVSRSNVRNKVSFIAKEVKAPYNTVKNHFLDRVIPACEIAHYFYPQGYNSYFKALIRITSDYEVQILKALELLPCTSFVYPIEKDLIIVLPHQNIKKVIKELGKMEEKAFIDGFLLYEPLYYSIPDYKMMLEE